MPGEDPFLYNNVTLPIYRVPLPQRQKRILALVAVALVLAVIGAVVGTRLLSRPREVRTTVRADLRALDARIWDTVSCLGGPEAHKDGRDLPAHLTRRSLRRADWPAVMDSCRQKAALLLAASSAITASANAAPSRVPLPIQRQYRKALTAAAAVQQAVAHLADDAHTGLRVPAWHHCVAAARAVAGYQRVLGVVERLADLPKPRRVPRTVSGKPPQWPTPARLTKGLPASSKASLTPLQPNRGHVALRLRDPRAVTPLLLWEPRSRARWVPLPARPAGARLGFPVRWLQALPTAKDAAAPRLLWAQLAWDRRTNRATLVTGDTGSFPPRAAPQGPILRGATARIHGGGGTSRTRWVLVSDAQGPSRTLTQFVTTEPGKWSPAQVLATDLPDPAQIRIWSVGGTTLVSYATRREGTALQALPATDAKAAPRAVMDTGTGVALRQVCGAGTRVWVLDGGGRLWRRDGPTAPLRTQPHPGRGGRQHQMICVGDRVAMTWQRPGDGRFRYAVCAATGCQPAQDVSWSRVREVRLVASRKGVLLLVAEGGLLFSRRDAKVTGRLQAPRPMTRWTRYPSAWTLVKGPSPTHLAVVLLDGGLARLRSENGGQTWSGD